MAARGQRETKGAIIDEKRPQGQREHDPNTETRWCLLSLTGVHIVEVANTQRIKERTLLRPPLRIIRPAAETVQETLIEQAKAQEITLQSNQDELRESLEAAFNQRLSRINDEVWFVQRLNTQNPEQASTPLTTLVIFEIEATKATF